MAIAVTITCDKCGCPVELKAYKKHTGDQFKVSVKLISHTQYGRSTNDSGEYSYTNELCKKCSKEYETAIQTFFNTYFNKTTE